MKSLLQLVWPPQAPLSGELDNESSRWWILTCILLVFPATAMLHHAIFYRPTCMLNCFGEEYYPSIIWMWLSKDPSLPWAIVIASIVYVAGRRYMWIRILAAPVFVSLLPVNLYVWDIPFSGRIICDLFHDGNSIETIGFALRAKHVYLFSLFIYCVFSGLVFYKRKMR